MRSDGGLAWWMLFRKPFIDLTAIREEKSTKADT